VTGECEGISGRGYDRKGYIIKNICIYVVKTPIGRTMRGGEIINRRYYNLRYDKVKTSINFILMEKK